MDVKNRFSAFRDSTGKPLAKAPEVVRPAANGIIFNERGEVLLHRRSDNGLWALPGGSVEIGESVEKCVVREVFEETGLRVAVKRLVGVYSDPKHYSIMSYPNGAVVHYVALLFECERKSGEVRISDESTDIGYFQVDRLPEQTLLSHHIRIKDSLVKRIEPFVR